MHLEHKQIETRDQLSINKAKVEKWEGWNSDGEKREATSFSPLKLLSIVIESNNR